MDNDNKEKKVDNKSKKGNNKTTQKNGTQSKKTNRGKSQTTGKKTSKSQKSSTSNNKKNVSKESASATKNVNAKKIEKVPENKNTEINDEQVTELVETKSEEINTLTEKNNNDNQGNKTVLVVLLAILVIIVGVCLFYQIDDKNKDKGETTEVSEVESSEIMDKFYEYFNNKDAKIIYYASSTCGYCELQTPIMEQIDKDYDIDYLYIDSTKLTKDDQEKMLKELGFEHATPTTVVVKNGKVIDINQGYIDGGEMVKFLIKAGILNEDAVYTPEQYITFINYSDYEDIVNSDDTSVVTIGQTGCSHCIATKPVLNVIAKDYNLKVNYLNLTEMSTEEQKSLSESLKNIGYDDEEFLSSGSFGTPLTLVIKDGKVISYINGENPTSYYIRKFKKLGLISE